MKTYAGFRRAWEPSREGDRHEAIDEFVETRLARYADDRDFPGRDATSRLSPLIASGASSASTMGGPDDMKLVKLAKNGRSPWTA